MTHEPIGANRMGPSRRVPSARRAWLAAVRVTGRAHLLGWLPHVAVGLLALPFIVRQNAEFEWSNALWLLDLQTAHISAHGLPTFFIDAPGQYFYPWNVFYAGPALSVLSYPSVVLGTWPVFAAVTAGAFGAASAGISWTARNLGVPPRLAIVPGVLFASTPYVVSNLYGRGAWTELVAGSAVAVVLGAATSLTTGRARSPRATVAVLALAVAAIAGTHNLTLLFAALLALPLAVALLPLLPGSRRELIRRHALVLAGGVLGTALCGAFLAPDVWLGGRTQITGLSSDLLHELRPFETLGALLNPTNAQPSGTVGTDLHTQTLVTPLAWILLTLALVRGGGRIGRRSAVALAGLGLLGLAIVLLIVEPSWWLSFPSVLRSIQFTFRLVTFLALVTVLGVIVLLARPAVRASRVAVVALLVASGWQLGLAADLALSASPIGASPAPTPANISAATIPAAFAPGLLQPSQFRLIVTDPLAAPAQAASVEPIGDDTPPQVVLYGTQAPGTLVATTVVSSPLIRLTGQAQIVGASADGFDVLRVNSSAPRPWHATVSAVCDTCVKALVGQAPLTLLAGRFATLLAALALVGLIANRPLRVAARASVRRGRRLARSRSERRGGAPPTPG